jgi:CheY-like chemotaxis protein
MTHILIAEDEPAIRNLLATILRRHTFHVTTVRDGVETLQQLSSGDVPDIVLLDLMMPTMSGWAVIAELQQRGGGLLERVVVLTAATEREASELPESVRVLRKPFEIDKLLAAIREIASRAVAPVAKALSPIAVPGAIAGA